MSWSTAAVDFLKIGGGAAVGYGLKYGIEKTKSRSPVVFNIDQDVSRIYGNVPDWVSFAYFFNCEPEQLPQDAPSKPLEWWSWSRNYNAIPAMHSEIQIVVSSRVERPLLVDNFRIYTETVPAPLGTVVLRPVGGAEITLKQISVDLDKYNSTVRFLDTHAAELPNFAFSLKKDDVAKFSITASISNQPENAASLFKWHGLLDVIIGSKLKTIRIDDHGSPFLLHGGGGSKVKWWNGQTWE